MTVIKASCPRDGEVELSQRDVGLRVCTQRPSLSRYEFICPLCFDEVFKPADEHIAELLISAGVRAELLELPAEVLEEHTGPPISYDDLLDFHLALERTDLLAEHARLNR